MEHDRLRIAMVSVEEPSAGQRVHVAGLSAALACRGHAVTAYTRLESALSPDRERTELGYDVVRLSAGPVVPIDENEMISQIGRLAELLGREWRDAPPDVVHAHGWTSGLASVLAEHRGTPVVQTYYGLGGSVRRSLAERIVGREVARVAAMSSNEVLALVRTGVGRSRISVVPTGVDVQMFTPWGRTARRGTRSRIVTAAPQRGLADLVKVLSHVEDAELLIIGGPGKRRIGQDPGLRRLRALAVDAGVADRVVFTGAVSRERTIALLRSADVVVCAARCEPVGHVSLEAMACGVPVVATAVGALADSVVDGVTGLHVPPGRPRLLAKALCGLLGDGVRRQELGAAARDRACARYSWDRIAADTLRAYERAGVRTAGPARRAGQDSAPRR
ncbi:glycosyltransferase [Lentzea flaviverrucosa]|uniref:Glycosyltransferase involved in cell wall bisynthesis n=1 Tax=Lentzea flaviverrucosa TaxID=200379 RepID=A0A1H9BDB2_9PSEU|nr:glycosyltransferase involved in cell wall biosynthesis [Lentzea flaviverrucosa]SEP86849.1 Glycosyltransferase involved in cell wall bisynthesis [Lentzea flaviverrucosa]